MCNLEHSNFDGRGREKGEEEEGEEEGEKKKQAQYFSGSVPRCILILIVVMNNQASYEEESVEYSGTLSCHN